MTFPRSTLRAAVPGALLSGLAAVSLSGATALAQDTTTSTAAEMPARPAALTVTTAYPSITINAGEEAHFPLTVTSPLDERVDLAVDGVPAGYQATLRGGDSIVSSVFTDATATPPLELRVRVPDDAAPGDQAVTVTATAASGTFDLPVDVVVTDVDPGQVSLEAKYPILSGDSGISYTFDLTLSNDTARDLTFGLTGTGPDGWTVDVAPSGADKASTALVTAGGRTNLRVTVDPATFAPAGRYLIGVSADGEGHTAAAQLGIEITGSQDLTLDTSDGRLNDAVSAGGSDTMTLVVSNTGTAPLSDVSLSARTPKGWTVAFDPTAVSDLEPATDQQVQAVITPAGNAVAGDYVVTMSATSGDTSDDIQVRSTVETSALWGVAAAGIIVLALGGLFLVFRRYGRR